MLSRLRLIAYSSIEAIDACQGKSDHMRREICLIQFISVNESSEKCQTLGCAVCHREKCVHF